MAAKIHWHRCGKKLRHCLPIYVWKVPVYWGVVSGFLVTEYNVSGCSERSWNLLQGPQADAAQGAM